jgi:uncharacterized protein YdaU (DUF1376 family)
MNFFKLYIGDYQRDTAHLSITEHGAYLLMLQHYYATEKPLPVGKALHRMLRAQDKDEREAIDSIVAQFWHETPDGLVNARADAEIAKASTQADTNRRIAVEREEKRKAARRTNEQSTNRVTNGEPNHSQTPDTRQNPKAESEDKVSPEDPGDSPTPALTAVVSSFARPLPAGWSPSADTVAKVLRARPDLADRIDSIAEDFRMYLSTQTGAKTLSADWEASFFRWAGRERDTAPKRVRNGRLPGGFVC